MPKTKRPTGRPSIKPDARPAWLRVAATRATNVLSTLDQHASLSELRNAARVARQAARAADWYADLIIRSPN